MSVLNREFLPPADWPAFERLCLDVYRTLWGDNEAQMHGRRGQSQLGVDIYGRQPGVGLVGVQCKGKDAGYRAKLTVAELKREVAKAKKFRPELRKFILATTAGNDAKVQEAARRLTGEHKASGLFEVHVVGWDTLKQLVANDRDVVRNHYADIAPLDLVEALRSETRPELAAIHEMLRTLTDRSGNVEASVQPKGPPPPDGTLLARLRDVTDLCNDGEPRAALRMLDKVRTDAWDGSGPEDRGRILVGLAFCRLAACEEEGALASFREAYATAPGHPGVRAAMALASLISGDRAGAYNLAAGALSADPSCELAAVLLPQAAPSAMLFADVRALVPETFLAIPAVLRALSQAASDRGDWDEAIRWAEQAHALTPDDWRSAAQLGAKLLATVADDDVAVGLTRFVAPEHTVTFARGVTLLREAWEGIRGNGNARRAPEVPANLCAALLLTGDEEGARSVLGDGLSAAPGDPNLLRRRGWFAAIDCDWPTAISSFAEMPNAELTGEDRFVVAKALLEDGRLDEARSAVAGLGRQEAADPGGRQRAAALALDVELAAGGGTDAVRAALDADPDSILVMAAAVPATVGDDGLRDRLGAGCRRAVASSADARDRALAADTLDRLGHHSEAADAFASVEVPMDIDTPILRGRLRALVCADRRRDARELLDRLPPGLVASQPYLTLALHLLDRTGDLSRATGLLEAAFLAGQDDLWARLAWVELAERSGDTGAAVAWLSTVREDVPGSPRHLMALAHAIDRLIGDVKAIAIAYRALRAGYDDPKIHVAYSFSLVMFGKAASRLPPQPTVVATGTAVTLSRTGLPDIVRVIEGGDAPSLARGEIPPSNPLALRLLGLRAGDELDLPVQGGPPEPFRVRLIEGRFLHAHRRTIETFHDRFPEERSFQTFQVDTGNGLEGLAPIIEVARQHTDRVRSLEAAYREGRLPIALFARMAGRHACDVWDVLRDRSDLPLTCALGTAAERVKATDDLASSEVQVLEPLSVYAAAALGLVSQVEAALPGRSVTRSTIDYLRALVMERREFLVAGGGTMGWDGHSLVVERPSDAGRTSSLATAERALAMALGCRLAAAEGPAPVPEAVGIYEALPEAFTDAIRAAQAPGHALVSDDLSFRLLASACGVAATGWTQPALRLGLALARLDVASFTEANGALAGTSYRFLSFADIELVYSLRVAGWTSEGHAAAFLARLADPGNEVAGVVGIAANVLLAAWQEGASRNAAGALVGAFLAENPDGARAIMDAALDVASARLRSRLWRSRRAAWAASTGLTPAEAVMARIAAPATRARTRLAACLGQAFLVAGPSVMGRSSGPVRRSRRRADASVSLGDTASPMVPMGEQPDGARPRTDATSPDGVGAVARTDATPHGGRGE